MKTLGKFLKEIGYAITVIVYSTLAGFGLTLGAIAALRLHN